MPWESSRTSSSSCRQKAEEAAESKGFRDAGNAGRGRGEVHGNERIEAAAESSREQRVSGCKACGEGEG